MTYPFNEPGPGTARKENGYFAIVQLLHPD